MNAYLELATLTISLVFLAIVLGVVGYAVNKVITRSQQSRFDSKVNSAAALARARAHARQAHA